MMIVFQLLKISRLTAVLEECISNSTIELVGPKIALTWMMMLIVSITMVVRMETTVMKII